MEPKRKVGRKTGEVAEGEVISSLAEAVDRAKTAYASYIQAEQQTARTYRGNEGQVTKAYRMAERQAQDAYEKAVAEALKARDEAILQALKKYEEAQKQADETFNRDKKQADGTFNKAVIKAKRNRDRRIDRDWETCREFMRQAQLLFARIGEETISHTET
jgi:tetratricopeptide (TPR) repeat protein